MRGGAGTCAFRRSTPRTGEHSDQPVADPALFAEQHGLVLARELAVLARDGELLRWLEG
jgi:hypothetical protein